MSAAAAIIGAVLPAAVQSGMSIYQLARGSQLSRTGVPQYQIPKALQDAYSMQRAYATQKEIPALSTMYDNILQSQQGTIEAMQKGGQGSPAQLGMVQAKTDEALGNMAIAGANYKIGEKDKFLDMSSKIAGEQANQWNWNVAMPYQQQMGTSSALQGAGLQNLYGSATSIADYFQSREYMDWMKGVYGMNNSGNSNNTKIGLPPDEVFKASQFKWWQ